VVEPDGRSERGLLAWNRRRRRAKKQRLAAMTRGRRIGRRFALAGTWLIAFLAVLSVGAVIAFYGLSNVPRPESLPLPQVATIYYSNGSVLARIGAQDNTVDRTIVPLSKVPVAVRWDVIAAEDRNFYNEPGVSVKGTIRAALSDLRGGDVQGGSTITQQYVKNAYLSDSRTLTRKLKELAIAVKLDRNYSKDDILAFYLNTVYFGRGAYGIDAAAQTFFGIPADRLDVSQGAVLASLLRAPSYYDPAQNRAAAEGRWQYVLDGMVSTKHLTAAQEATLTYPKTRPLRTTNGLGASGPTALVVRQVLAELQSDGISEDEVYARGLRIHTTINQRAQSDAVAAVRQTFANLTKKQRNLKNALVAINPSSGGVLAYYGGPDGTDYAGQADYNDYAAIGSRPPGSSFKPYTLATVLTQTLDKTQEKTPLTINSKVDGSYCVRIQGTRICNDPGDRGVSSPSVTIANAMKYSLNTTFDQLAADAGPANVAATAHAAGIAPTDSNGHKTLADPDGQTSFGIGIGDYAVHPIDQAAGFATFADGGKQHAPYFVTRVDDSDGHVVFTHHGSSKQALDPKVANDVTLTLEPIAAWSNDPLANGRVSAAKTGTEGISTKTNANSDAWMVGYTPQVSTAVWVGSGDSTTPIVNANGAPEYGSDLPGRTWALFMNTYLAGQPHAPMPTKQMIYGGEDPSPSATHPNSTSGPPADSSAGGSSSSASTSAPLTSTPPPPSSSAPPSSPTPSPSCTRLLQLGCSSSPSPPAG
jgi:membrane peptidoglycan carboxypeptidase